MQPGRHRGRGLTPVDDDVPSDFNARLCISPAAIAITPRNPAGTEVSAPQTTTVPRTAAGPLSAESLPYEDATFDLVLASLMLHELTAQARDSVVWEMVRVLTPTGPPLVTEFHPGPWRIPKGWIYRAISLVAESVAGHRDRPAAFLTAGGAPGLAAGASLPPLW